MKNNFRCKFFVYNVYSNTFIRLKITLTSPKQPRDILKITACTLNGIEETKMNIIPEISNLGDILYQSLHQYAFPTFLY